MTSASDGEGGGERVARARAPRRRPLTIHLLGIFVIYHLAALVLQALPDPGVGLKRSAWQEPTVQQEFRVWAGFFSRFGREVTVDELQRRLWEIAQAVTSTRKALVRPFAPYVDYVGMRQPWRMFVAPHRFPTSLVIDVREGDGPWRTIFVERSNEHTWRRAIFDHDRMRAALFRYGWPEYNGTYRDLGRFIARKAAADFPEATQVRVRMLKRRSPTPEEVRAGQIPEGDYRQELVIALEGFRR